jgi:hypothetical protein
MIAELIAIRVPQRYISYGGVAEDVPAPPMASGWHFPKKLFNAVCITGGAQHEVQRDTSRVDRVD